MRPPRETPTISRHWLACSLLAALGVALSACSMGTWHAAEPSAPLPSSLHGDLRCAAGQADCNACAENVVEQFSGRGWSEGNSSWSFGEYQSSHGVTVDQSYHRSSFDHVQGFVRLYGPGVRYAMIHSGGSSRRKGRFAPLSLIVQQPDGQNWLS
jgi:hypothetical protein